MRPPISMGLEVTSLSILAISCSVSVEQSVSQSDDSSSLLEMFIMYITDLSESSESYASSSNNFLAKLYLLMIIFFAIFEAIRSDCIEEKFAVE